MAFTYDFCRARAQEEAVAAEAATLDNVRERALRSEAAWLAMAKREQQLTSARDKAKREKDEASAALLES